jgi:glycogen operon protein
MDLVSYNEKHNEANGEQNRDGDSHNESWNCGWEGPTDDEEVLALRRRQIKNVVTLLMVSQGVPMVLSGDEFGNSQQGNNNAYCQDNALSWLNWEDLEENQELLHFFRKVIALRKAHSVLRNPQHFRGSDYVGSGLPDISWHGQHPWSPDWSSESRAIAFLLCGKHAKGGAVTDDHLYVAINMHPDSREFGLPTLPDGSRWHVAVNTGMGPGEDAWDTGEEPDLEHQERMLVGTRSIVVLLGR